MKRRAFLTRAFGLLAAPAFVKASSLWLPPERPFIPAVIGLEEIQRQAARAYLLMGQNGNLTAWVTPRALEMLKGDLQALDRYKGATHIAGIELSSIKFHTLAGSVEVFSSPYISSDDQIETFGRSDSPHGTKVVLVNKSKDTSTEFVSGDLAFTRLAAAARLPRALESKPQSPPGPPPGCAVASLPLLRRRAASAIASGRLPPA